MTNPSQSKSDEESQMKSAIAQSNSDEATDFTILLFTGDAQGRPCTRLLSSQVYAALVTIEYHESRLVFVLQ